MRHDCDFSMWILERLVQEEAISLIIFAGLVIADELQNEVRGFVLEIITPAAAAAKILRCRTHEDVAAINMGNSCRITSQLRSTILVTP